MLLVKGALPAVAVATLIPMAVFYTVMLAGSVAWAIAMSAVYAEELYTGTPSHVCPVTS